MWMAIAITAIIVAIGNIFFGHFEEHTPKTRRVGKTILVLAIVGALSHYFGAAWGLAPVALMLVGVLVIHGWWLPRQGINGWTGEPRDKYYELRGWKQKAAAATSKES
jgi:hypothetical protein